MKIAYILPSLAAKAPIFLALNLAEYFLSKGDDVSIFYFDDIVECKTTCKTFKINLSSPITFDEFDIIHTHMLRPDKYIYKYRKLIHKAKTISTIHCDIKQDLKYSYGSLISFIFTKRWIKYLRTFSKTVQISDYLMDLYKAKLQRNILIYNSVNIDYTEQESHKEIISKISEYKGKDLKVLCSYSGLVKRKGLIQILKALKRDESFAYICIGNGPEKVTLEKYVKKHNLESRVTFYNFVKNPYLLMNYADVFCIPSFSEGFSLALLEAGAIGSSVVCSNIPSFTKIFTNDEVSFYDLENIDSLVFAINSAYVNKENFKINLKQRICTDFTQERMVNDYENLYFSHKGGNS